VRASAPSPLSNEAIEFTARLASDGHRQAVVSTIEAKLVGVKRSQLALLEGAPPHTPKLPSSESERPPRGGGRLMFSVSPKQGKQVARTL
jgi:hypothetical protein